MPKEMSLKLPYNQLLKLKLFRAAKVIKIKEETFHHFLIVFKYFGLSFACRNM